jgi:hypothetical protein
MLESGIFPELRPFEASIDLGECRPVVGRNLWFANLKVLCTANCEGFRASIYALYTFIAPKRMQGLRFRSKKGQKSAELALIASSSGLFV